MSPVPEHWQPGQSVVLRNCGFFVGEVWGTPHIVVEDTDERVVLYRPEGTKWSIWRIDEKRFVDRAPTRMDMLRLMFPGKAYAVELYFATEHGQTYPDFAHLKGRFRGWKLNVEAVFRRTEHGFDTTDDVLDIFVEPDGTWHWTDETEVDFWVQHGAYSLDNRKHFFDTAAAVEPKIARGEAPFDHEWVDWTPPASFETPRLPLGWELLEGWDFSQSAGRRYDAWRAGHDAEHVARVVQDWRDLIDANRKTPAARRFRTGKRLKG